MELRFRVRPVVVKARPLRIAMTAHDWDWVDWEVFWPDGRREVVKGQDFKKRFERVAADEE